MRFQWKQRCRCWCPAAREIPTGAACDRWRQRSAPGPGRPRPGPRRRHVTARSLFSGAIRRALGAIWATWDGSEIGRSSSRRLGSFGWQVGPRRRVRLTSCRLLVLARVRSRGRRVRADALLDVVRGCRVRRSGEVPTWWRLVACDIRRASAPWFRAVDWVCDRAKIRLGDQRAAWD